MSDRTDAFRELEEYTVEILKQHVVGLEAAIECYRARIEQARSAIRVVEMCSKDLASRPPPAPIQK